MAREPVARERLREEGMEEKEVRQFTKGQPGLLSLPNWPNDLLSSG